MMHYRHPFSLSVWSPKITPLAAAIVVLCIGGQAGYLAAQSQPAPQLYVMSADGKEVKPLTSMAEYNAQGSPTWSRDGKKIACDAWRASAGETSSAAHVFIMDADGGDPQDLGVGAMPSFSPDGRQIAFTRYSPQMGVWIMNADGSNDRRIDEEGWSGHWSPDGRMLAYAHNHGGANVAVYDLKTNKRRRILEGDQASRYRYVRWNLCWSPDSKWVCFKAQNQEEKYELAIAHVDGSSKGFKVLLKENTDEDVAWRPDGKQILISRNDPMRKIRQLYLLDPHADKPPKYVRGQPYDRANLNGDWSPDGKWIVFSSRAIKK